MKKIVLLTALVAGTLTLANDLYTDTYFSQSGIVKPRVDTGIPNPISINTLMHKRNVAHTSLYFQKGVLTQESATKLDQIIKAAQGKNSSYVTVIGHTASYTRLSESVHLNAWVRFWQNSSSSSITLDDVAASINQRIATVYDQLKAKGVSRQRIYTENRMDRDPISTEATKRGRALNCRVDVAVYR